MTKIITPERLIEMGWLIDLKICELRKEAMPDDFLIRCAELAEKARIAVFQVNFNDYSSPAEALSAHENRGFVSAIENPSEQTLLIFENADCLAPLDCNLTYTLRTVLTTPLECKTVSLFSASDTAIQQLFHCSDAAFYHSSYKIC